MASVVVSMLAIKLKGYGIQSYPPCTTPTGKFISTAPPLVSNCKKNPATKQPVKFASIIKPNNLSESGPKLNEKHTNRISFSENTY